MEQVYDPEAPAVANERDWRIYYNRGTAYRPGMKTILAFNRQDAVIRFSKMYPLAVIVGVEPA